MSERKYFIFHFDNFTSTEFWFLCNFSELKFAKLMLRIFGTQKNSWISTLWSLMTSFTSFRANSFASTLIKLESFLELTWKCIFWKSQELLTNSQMRDLITFSTTSCLVPFRISEVRNVNVVIVMEVVCYLNTETWILCLMDSRTIFLFTEKCLLSKDIKDYSFVSQGKVSSHSVEIAKIFTHYIFSKI